MTAHQCFVVRRAGYVSRRVAPVPNISMPAAARSRPVGRARQWSAVPVSTSGARRPNTQRKGRCNIPIRHRRLDGKKQRAVKGGSTRPTSQAGGFFDQRARRHSSLRNSREGTWADRNPARLVTSGLSNLGTEGWLGPRPRNDWTDSGRRGGLCPSKSGGLPDQSAGVPSRLPRPSQPGS